MTTTADPSKQAPSLAVPPASLRDPAALEALVALVETVYRLRAPGGCAWDRAQSHQSLRQYLIEEAYEVLDVIDQIPDAESLRDEKVRAAFREELGDLLMQVVLHAEMTREAGVFDFYDVARGLNEKLIRRHPHVFGEAKAETEDAALRNWEKQKQQEKALKPGTSILDGLPKNLPALQRTGRLIEKVTKVGFQWPDAEGPLEKLEEELGELKTEIRALELAKTQKDEAHTLKIRKRVEAELGDVLFCACNLAFLAKINPEDALRGMLQKFETRFRHVEEGLRSRGKQLDQSTLAEMDELWNEAKTRE